MELSDDFLVEYGYAINGIFTRNKFYKASKSEYGLSVISQKARDTDIYRAVYQYETDDKTKIDDCNIIAPLYFDIDGDTSSINSFGEALTSVKKIVVFFHCHDVPLKCMNIYFSGAKGFHILIDHNILGLKPSKTLNALYKKIATYLAYHLNLDNLDLKIYDRRRLIRVPNTIHSKTGLYKVPIDYKQLITFNQNDMSSYAKEKHILKNDSVIIKPTHKILRFINNIQQPDIKKHNTANCNNRHIISEVMPCIKRIIEGGAAIGTRNNTAAILCSALFQLNNDLDEVSKMMFDWNDNNVEPLPTRELEITIASVHRMHLEGKNYGCTYIKEFGYCVKDCKLNGSKKIND